MKRTLVIALAVVIAAVATAPAPVVAEEPSTFDRLTETVGSFFDRAIGAAAGQLNRVLGDGADRDAADAAADLQSGFDAGRDDIQAWTNARVNASSSLDVLELTLEVDGDEETLYLVADVENGTYADASLVESTDRTADESCVLEATAARNAADELDTFVDEFAEPDRDVDDRYLARLATQYRGEVDCSFLE